MSIPVLGVQSNTNLDAQCLPQTQLVRFVRQEGSRTREKATARSALAHIQQPEEIHLSIDILPSSELITLPSIFTPLLRDDLGVPIALPSLPPRTDIPSTSSSSSSSSSKKREAPSSE